jgi:hypothetical protein
MAFVIAGLVPATHKRRGESLSAAASNALDQFPLAFMGHRDKPGGDGSEMR